MTLALRYRMLITLLPLLALLAFIGGAAVVLLHRLSGSIDAILRENYDSVLYMERLKEALQRIDRSFPLALAGREATARQQYEDNWRTYLENLKAEQNNITVTGERELVEQLTEQTKSYRRDGDAFFNRLEKELEERKKSYFDPTGLEKEFDQIKSLADRTLRLNQQNMEETSRQARLIARRSLYGFGLGFAAAGALGTWLAWRTVRAIQMSIQTVAASARAIGSGDLDQVLPITSHDELGQLAEEFNGMARQLRHYRKTDYARLIRMQRTTQATIDSFPHPVLVVDPEGRVEMANPAAQRLLGVAGRPPDSLPGTIWQPPEALREPLHGALAQSKPYLPEDFERAFALRVDGEERVFLPRLLPMADPYGQNLGAAVLLEDVTRFRLLDQMKGDLVATASHEMKTPLTSVRLAVHLLLEETVGPLTTKQTELLLDARENAERLLAMVNNMLDLAQLEQGSQHLQMNLQSPTQLLQAAKETAAPRAEDKGVQLVVVAADNLPQVSVDLYQFGHALSNLIDNALNYTDRGGTITLGAELAGDRVILTVADTGVGISREHLTHLFERFFRIPGQSRGTGTGLGLAIVHEIVVAHGGTITCESDLGQGTIFRLSLPVATEPVTARGPTP